MSLISLSKTLNLSRKVDTESIIEFLKQELNKSCKYKVKSETEDQLVLAGNVKEKWIRVFAKFDATIEIRVEGEKARISVHGATSPNWVFWLFAVVFAPSVVMPLIAIALYWYQREKPAVTFALIMAALDTEIGAL